MVDTYSISQEVGDITYHIGADSLMNVGKYIFTEDPVCQYPETVTLTNLPSFVEHNESTSDFTISRNADLSLIGSYLVTIRSEIQVPDDATSSSFSTFFV